MQQCLEIEGASDIETVNKDIFIQFIQNVKVTFSNLLLFGISNTGGKG